MKYIEIPFRKPLWVNKKGAYIRLRKRYIDLAINQGKKLKIDLAGYGSFIQDPVKWKETGKLSEQIFLRPDEPMVLIGNYINIPSKEQQSLF